MIDISNNESADYDTSDPHLDLTEPPDASASPPISCGARETNVIVERQEESQTREYNDSFCTNQGCHYENEASGDAECVQ